MCVCACVFAAAAQAVLQQRCMQRLSLPRVRVEGLKVCVSILKTCRALQLFELSLYEGPPSLGAPGDLQEPKGCLPAVSVKQQQKKQKKAKHNNNNNNNNSSSSSSKKKTKKNDINNYFYLSDKQTKQTPTDTDEDECINGVEEILMRKYKQVIYTPNPKP